MDAMIPKRILSAHKDNEAFGRPPLLALPNYQATTCSFVSCSPSKEPLSPSAEMLEVGKLGEVPRVAVLSFHSTKLGTSREPHRANRDIPKK